MVSRIQHHNNKKAPMAIKSSPELVNSFANHPSFISLNSSSYNAKSADRANPFGLVDKEESRQQRQRLGIAGICCSCSLRPSPDN
jgi:hypothetical protein